MRRRSREHTNKAKEGFLTQQFLNRDVRERYDVMKMPEHEFVKAFAITKPVFAKILLMCMPSFVTEELDTLFNTPPEIKLAGALNYYVTGVYNQKLYGGVMLHHHGIETAVDNVRRMTRALKNRLYQKYIRFPEDNTMLEYARRFVEQTSFPRVVGCMDCVYIDLEMPKCTLGVSLDKRDKFSIKLQLVCNYDLQILGVDARYEGSRRDSDIWMLSVERTQMRQIFLQNRLWLLGDTEYPLEEFLVTPFNTVSSPAECDFNAMHAKAMAPVRRCHAALIGTFACLKSLKCTVREAGEIAVVCCALLNICLENKLGTVISSTSDSDYAVRPEDKHPRAGEEDYGFRLKVLRESREQMQTESVP